jgi:4-hydroxy-tetrahydrodipicolinate reductase
MKIALLGKGKTGSRVLENRAHEIISFDSKNPPTFEKLETFDGIISFLPGEVFRSFIPLLVETKLPVVTGSTGFEWPAQLPQTLVDKKIGWIYASNFSLGVVLIKRLLNQLRDARVYFPSSQIHIHEIHHTQKKDAPSGTALSMKEWIGGDCTISSERQGEVIGFHELSFDLGSETIKISHEALDRKLFSDGAIWAMEYLYQHKTPGLHSFQDLLHRSLGT